MSATRPLGLDDSLELDDHCKNLSAIEKESLEAAVQLFAQSEHISIEFANRARLEFLRFFSLLFFIDTPLAPARTIRRFWVTFASLNEEYASFIGRHFKHFQMPVPQGDINFPALYVEHTRMQIARFFPEYDEQLWQT